MNWLPWSSPKSKSSSTRSTGVPASASSASAEVPQLPAISKSGSDASRRLRPSRNRMWSSSNNSRIGFMWDGLHGAGDGQVDDERAARRGGIVAQFAAERAGEGPREIQAQPGGLGAPLEGLEQRLRRGDAGAGVAHPN